MCCWHCQFTLQIQNYRIFKGNQLSLKNGTVVAHSFYISPKVSKVPGYILLTRLNAYDLDLRTTETVDDFKKFLFIKCRKSVILNLKSKGVGAKSD